MYLAILLIVVILVIVFVARLKKSRLIDEITDKEKPDEETNRYQYKSVGQLLTPAEVSFKHALKIAIEAKYDINAKVRLADIIEVEKGYSRSEWQKAFNKINRKHIDYVLTDRKTSEIICCIELDDNSHTKNDRQERDRFVDEALKSAKIKIIHIKATESYSTESIKEVIIAAGQPSSHPLA